MDYEARELDDDDSNVVQVENLTSHALALHEDSQHNHDLDADVVDADNNAGEDNSLDLLTDDDDDNDNHDIHSLERLRTMVAPSAVLTAATSATVPRECGDSDMDMALDEN